MNDTKTQTKIPYAPGTTKGNMKPPPTTEKPNVRPQGQKPPPTNDRPLDKMPDALNKQI